MTRIEATATTLSWIPSEAVTGLTKAAFETGFTHYDPPPPDDIAGATGLERLRADDRFRYANVLAGWAEVEDSRIVRAGYAGTSGVRMGSTTVRIGRLGATFAAVALPDLRREPEYLPDGSVRLTQTCGGRAALPAPRAVPHPPFVKLQSPLVWTTLCLTIHPDGRTETSLPGASAFPRHWVYDNGGALTLKSGLTDYSGWAAHSFGSRTPWGDEDSPALTVEVESAAERVLSRLLMGGEQKPRIRSLAADEMLTLQGEPGDELYLLLDGVLRVEVDGRRLAEVGPGAVLGERAVLEGGRRTSTLIAATPVRVAVAPSTAVDRERLAALAGSHRREDVTA
ncbi:cyclic nucleotide-binding domain-containing protein [Jiangella ureilytica]|uniref:Cyclic nucleotide-binding domain-containing protein n=1 Tax=Jiangella ureilytica TaxID=2530374 RepID=A0A4V2XW57_9ACTN|nr:cyclic nucleotide-binding domain-containing protein [Jiangella ureilytica]TDC47995.1 cyclic nucleotide-binding domain-containing protein [Jiangella ureilytica]